MAQEHTPWVRDENGVLHVVALSGGHDSTALALLLKDREKRPYNYVCTPTGDELPEMFAHWRNLGERLGSLLYPMSRKTLDTVIREQGALPNFRMRYCTRILKIEPYREFLEEQAKIGPVVSYVGLRADEEGRAGGAYGDIDGVSMRFPLREWGMGENAVQATLAERGIRTPDRTDCARCYHQRIGEWWELWNRHDGLFDSAACIIPLVDTALFINEWGEVMQLARRASSLATEDARRRGIIRDRLEASLIILTDCPVTAGWFAFSDDLAAICGVSHIASVRIMFANLGDHIPAGMFEAVRADTDMPRVWARMAQ